MKNSKKLGTCYNLYFVFNKIYNLYYIFQIYVKTHTSKDKITDRQLHTHNTNMYITKHVLNKYVVSEPLYYIVQVYQ